MSDTTPQTEKTIGSIGQPDDEDLPGIEFLSYPLKSHGRAAVATFKNGSELRFQIRTDGGIYQESFFASGQKCESFEVDPEKDPSEHLNQVLEDYSTVSKDDLRTSRPGLWPVLEVEDV